MKKLYIIIGVVGVSIGLLMQLFFSSQMFGATQTIDPADVEITGGNIVVTSVTTTNLNVTNCVGCGGSYTADLDLIVSSTVELVPALADKYFIPTSISGIVIIDNGNLASDYVINIGYNSPNYDNVGSLTAMSGVGTLELSAMAGIYPGITITTNTALTANIVADTGQDGAGTLRATVSGYYVDE